MKTTIGKINDRTALFVMPLQSWKQWLLVVLVGTLFVFMPLCPPPNDWVLNTNGLWKSPLVTIYQNQNRVYPPWAIYLLLPLYFLGVEGIRFISVMTIAWLTKIRQWSFYTFFLTVLSPYLIRVSVTRKPDRFTASFLAMVLQHLSTFTTELCFLES